MNSPLLVIASRNRKKAAEIAELLKPHGIDVRSLLDVSDQSKESVGSTAPFFESAIPDIVEDGQTFAENAVKKAVEVARAVSQWTLGEDSGLMVDALHGAPGVYSARYSGEAATDEQNNRKLIAELVGVPDEQRGAQYVCHAAVANPTGQIRWQVEATCRGRIVSEPRGSNGFGYDPLFLIPEYHRTFGELSPVVKKHLSHRGRALDQLIPRLVRLLTEVASR